MSVILLLIVAALAAVIAFAIAVWATGRDTLEPAPSTAGFPPGRGIDESAVAVVRFDTGLRGYRSDQVDEALRHVAWELGRRDEIIAQLEAQLSDCMRQLNPAENEPLDEEPEESGSAPSEPNDTEPVDDSEDSPVDDKAAVGEEPEAAPTRKPRRGSVSPLSDSSPGEESDSEQ